MYVHSLDSLISFRGTKQEICDKIELITKATSSRISDTTYHSPCTDKGFIVEINDGSEYIEVLVLMLKTRAKKDNIRVYYVTGVLVDG